MRCAQCEVPRIGGVHSATAYALLQAPRVATQLSTAHAIEPLPQLCGDPIRLAAKLPIESLQERDGCVTAQLREGVTLDGQIAQPADLVERFLGGTRQASHRGGADERLERVEDGQQSARCRPEIVNSRTDIVS